MSSATSLIPFLPSSLVQTVFASFSTCVSLHLITSLFFPGTRENKYQGGAYMVAFVHAFIASMESIFLATIYFLVPNWISSKYFYLDEIKQNPLLPNLLCQRINAITLGYFFWDIIVSAIGAIRSERNERHEWEYLIHAIASTFLYWTCTFNRYSFIGAIFLYFEISSTFRNIQMLMRIFYDGTIPASRQPIYDTIRRVFGKTYLICRLFLGTYLTICAGYSVMTEELPKKDKVSRIVFLTSGGVLITLSFWWAILSRRRPRSP